MFFVIARVIEAGGLPLGCFRMEIIGQRQSLGFEFLGEIFATLFVDEVNEQDLLVFTGSDPSDHFPPRLLGINDRFAPSRAIIDHDNEICGCGFDKRLGSMHAG